MKPDPLSLYRAARESGTSASGFYNDNIRAETDDGSVIVRIPIHGADGMDLRIWPEQDVIRAVAPWVSAVPEVLLVSPEPAFQLHRFVAGDVVDTVAPRGEAVPAHLLEDVVRFFGQLRRVPIECLPQVPADWPKDRDTAAFGARLSAVTVDVWERFRQPYAALYSALGVPTDPFERVVADWDRMTARPFGALHCDVHRKNLIVCDGRTFFLDWELALWGDPLYDLAVHLHKMDYLPQEAETVRAAWFAAMPVEVTTGAVADLAVYVRHERVKSALVDAVRYSKLILGGVETAREDLLVGSLTTKLDRARAVWGIGTPLDREQIRAALTRHVPRAAGEVTRS
ncbi:aminoglycoside phosphotransferase family protein [Streptomyces sp. SID3343]|uniref:phosphotransferase family protein n=1 Tax=Streptomyces sp. SID3343 TaxID=2690260 RepID=UPI00136BAF7C|nr:aminoglycoside phosphotransferase family protein [Streptomyces sp. SID3343]MYV98401.1 phosphotransferase [Streptomyces sp. SID3343]